MKKKCDMSRPCSEKSWSEPTALNLWNPGCPEYDLYEKTKILQSPGSKLKLGAMKHQALLKHRGGYKMQVRGILVTVPW